MAEKLGKEIVQQFPDLAESYKPDDATLDKIARKIIPDKYEENRHTARNAVYYALEEAFESKEEKRELAKKHSREGPRDAFFSLSKEERKEKMLQVLRGKLKNKSAEEVSINLISDEEREFFYAAFEDPKFQHKSGYKVGSPDYNLISQEAKVRFKKGRTNGALRTLKRRFKKAEELSDPGSE